MIKRDKIIIIKNFLNSLVNEFRRISIFNHKVYICSKPGKFSGPINDFTQRQLTGLV